MNNHEQTSVTKPCPSTTEEQLVITTAKFADIAVEDQAETAEFIGPNVPTQDSVVCANSAAASLAVSCSETDVTSSVLPSQGSQSVCQSSAVRSDNPPQCLSPDAPGDTQRSASSRTKKRNKSSAKNEATPSSSNTAGWCLSFELLLSSIDVVNCISVVIAVSCCYTV